MKITLFVAALAIVAVAAISGVRAQQPPASADPLASLAQDWNAYQNAQRHVIEGIQAVSTELQKARADNTVLVKERDELKAEIAKIKGGTEKKL